MIAYTRFEVLRTARNVRLLILSLAMPVGLYMLFNAVAVSGHLAGGIGGSYLISMAGFSMFTAAMTANATLPAERAGGWLRQLRITPLSGASWLAAKVALAVAVVVPGLLALSASAVLIGHVSMSAGQWAAFVALELGGAVPFAFLGLLLGQLLDVQSVQPVQGVLMMVLGLGGGLLFPLQLLPDPAQVVARLLPTHLFFAIGLDVVSRHSPSPGDVAGLTAWAVVLAAAALAVWVRQGAGRLAPV